MATSPEQPWTPPRVAPAAKNLGTGRGDLDARRLSDAQVDRNARLAQHGACADHVKVDGLKHKLCVLRGEDPETVIAVTRALLAGADR